MKKLIVCALIALVAITINAQGIERLHVSEKTGFVTFSRVVENPTKNKSQLFSDIKEWIAVTFGMGRVVTDLADEETGKYILKPIAMLKMMPGVEVECRYMLVISIKDGKARIVADHFNCEHSYVDGQLAGGGWETPEKWIADYESRYKLNKVNVNRISDLLADEIEAILQSFENAIKAVAHEEDW